MQQIESMLNVEGKAKSGLGLGAAFTGAHLRGAVLTLWRPFAVTFAVALVLIGAATLLATSDELGGIPQWIQNSLLSLALAVRGHANLAVNGDTGTFSVVAMPTTLTAVLLGLLWWESRGAERRTSTGPTWVATAVLSLTTAFAAALVLALITSLDRISVEASTAQTRALVDSYAASFWWTLLCGTLLMGIAIAAGRFSARLSSGDDASPAWLVAIGHQLKSWRSGARPLRTQLLVGGSLAAAVAFVLVLRQIDGGRDVAATFLVGLLFLPTLALGGLALSMGASVTFATGLLGSSLSTGMLVGKLAVAYYLAPLIPIVATIVAGVREGLRHPERGQWPATTWWRLPSLAALTWLSIGFFAWFSLIVDSDGAGGILAAASTLSYSVHLGLILLPFLAIVWGLALLAVQVFLTERFAGMFPRLALRLGGRSIDSGWRRSLEAVLSGAPADPDVLPLPNRRRAGRIVAILVVAILVVLAALGVTLSVAANALGSPSKTVEAVFRAVNDGDVDYLTDHVSNWPATGAASTSAALKATHTGVRALTEVSTTTSGSGDSRQVRVSYRVNGTEQEQTLYLTKSEDKRYGFIPTWRVSGLTGNLSVSISGSTSIRSYNVMGVEGSLSGPTTVAPGAYDVSAPATAGLTAVPQVVVVRPGGFGQAQLVVSVADTTKTKILAELDNLVASCAATNLPNPPNCPFSSYAFSPTNFRWTVNSKPSGSAVVQLRSYSGDIVVSGDVDLTAKYDQQSFFGGDTAKTDSVTTRYTLKATINGDAVTLSKTF